MLNDTPQWVAIYTDPRAEKRAAQRLEEKGLEAYLPLLIKLHQWSDRWKRVEVPLIPSYIFAKIRDTDVVHVRATEGVGHIISWSGKPAIVPDSEIEAMRRLVNANAELHVVDDTKLKKGATVRIIEGPFVGMRGTLISGCEEGNFCISISGINVALITTIDQQLIKPVEKDEVPKRQRHHFKP